MNMPITNGRNSAANFYANNKKSLNVSKMSQNKEASAFKAWLNDADKVSTDGIDDGKISLKEAGISYAKGLFGIVKSAINHPVITGLSVAGALGLTVATGGAILPIFTALGGVMGGVSILGGGYKAITAKTDGDKKQAFETMGNGTFALAASALSAGKAIQAAGQAGVESAESVNITNPIQNLINCVKISPDAIKTSGLNIKGNYLTLKTGAIHANSNALRKNQVKYMSKPNEAQSYRFNPEGTTEEILKNNQGVFQGEDGGFYVKNKWNEAAPFKIDTTKEQMIMMYDGLEDMAVCDGGIFEGSYVDTEAFKATGALNYQKPSSLEYGKVIDVTKQAKGAFKQAPIGTKVQTLEGLTTVGEGQVIAIDHEGNPYVTTAANVFKRNLPKEGFEEAFKILEQIK